MAAKEADLKALMLAGLNGDALAHQTLLRELSGRLRGYYKGKLSHLGRSLSEAEDLVQETLIAIHTRRHTYHRSEALMPWVYAIARYKLIDHLRQMRAPSSFVPVDQADHVLAQDDHMATESSYDVQRLLNRLPDKTRRAIKSVKLDGLSVAETAKLYNITESSVKVIVHRGLKALSALIAQGKMV